MRIIDDHVKMFRNGNPALWKLIPMRTVESWKRDGVFESSRYTFAPGAEEIFDGWLEAETRKRKLDKKRPAILQRDPGFADISRAIGEAAEAEMPLPVEPESEIPDVADLPKDSEAEVRDILPEAEMTEILED